MRKKRKISKSATARAPVPGARKEALPPGLEDIADVVGSGDDDLPSDLSARTKHYLRLWGYGRDGGR
jgi:hypothetical protein